MTHSEQAKVQAAYQQSVTKTGLNEVFTYRKGTAAFSLGLY
jgi:hypothetical protein